MERQIGSAWFFALYAVGLLTSDAGTWFKPQSLVDSHFQPAARRCGLKVRNSPDRRPWSDINALHQTIGPVATAGFFCNGEIGPIGEKPFVHGFTSVIGLFTEPEPER